MQEAYITSDELFNSIKEDFYSYDNAGLLDEGQFYRHVSYIIGLLGIAWYQEEDDIKPVTNYKVELPRNFSLLDQAYKCDCKSTGTRQPDGVVLKNKIFSHFPEECSTPCDPCPVPTDCVLNTQENLLIQRDNVISNYSNFSLLRIGNRKTRSVCKENCANIMSNSLDSITIEGKNMFTNFREGNVYVRYYAFPLDEETGLPLIPNNEKVMKCIEYYIKSKLLENMWVNGDANVAQMVQYFDSKYQTALGDAMSETKLSSFNTLVNAVKNVRKKLNVYQLNTRY